MPALDSTYDYLTRPVTTAGGASEWVPIDGQYTISIGAVSTFKEQVGFNTVSTTADAFNTTTATVEFSSDDINGHVRFITLPTTPVSFTTAGVFTYEGVGAVRLKCTGGTPSLSMRVRKVASY